MDRHSSIRWGLGTSFPVSWAQCWSKIAYVEVLLKMIFHFFFVGPSQTSFLPFHLIQISTNRFISCLLTALLSSNQVKAFEFLKRICSGQYCITARCRTWVRKGWDILNLCRESYLSRFEARRKWILGISLRLSSCSVSFSPSSLLFCLLPGLPLHPFSGSHFEACFLPWTLPSVIIWCCLDFV